MIARKVGELRTRKRNVTFVLSRVPPLQYREGLVDRKTTRGILECNDSFFVHGQLPDVRMLLELKLWPDYRRRR